MTLSGAYTLHKTRSLSIINQGKVTQQAMSLVILGLHNNVMSDVCPTVIATVTLWIPPQIYILNLLIILF